MLRKISPHFSRAVLCCIVFVSLAGPILADDSMTDFEGTPEKLPGWTAMGPNADGKTLGRGASQWTEPFTVALDGETVHEGASSLKWHFTEEVTGQSSLNFTVPVGGPEIAVHFFVKTQGLNSDGLFSLNEQDSAGARKKLRWGVEKIPNAEDWAEVSWSGKMEPGTQSLRLIFSFGSVPSGAAIWLDDISVRTIESR